jgi:hypothetical protein
MSDGDADAEAIEAARSDADIEARHCRRFSIDAFRFLKDQFIRASVWNATRAIDAVE